MTQSRRLAIALLLNLALVAGLLIVGLAAGSLGVLAAGGDSLADAMAIGLGLLAIHLRDRSGVNRRATDLAAAVNASLLLIVTVAVVVEASRRLLGHPPKLNGLPVVIASLITVAVMTASALVVGTGDDADDLHMRSIVMDAVADAVSAGGVAVTGATILWQNGLYWLDSAVALVIASVIAAQAARLLREVYQALRRPLDLQ